MGWFSKNSIDLAIDRKNIIRAKLKVEAIRLDSQTTQENAARKLAAEEKYAAEQKAWFESPDKPLPFRIEDDMMIVGDAYVFLKAIDSFQWHKGCGPIEYLPMLMQCKIVVTTDGESFHTEDHWYALNKRPDEIIDWLTASALNYEPHHAALHVNVSGGDSRLRIICPEYAREHVHEQFLAALPVQR